MPVCRERSPSPWAEQWPLGKGKRWDRTQLQVGDIQVRELPGAQAWVGTNRVLARAAVMRKNFLSLCPGLPD